MIECSQRAWAYAAEASYQTTPFVDGSSWQNEIVSVVEDGDKVTVTLRREDGSTFQEICESLAAWYGE